MDLLVEQVSVLCVSQDILSFGLLDGDSQQEHEHEAKKARRAVFEAVVAAG